MYFNKLKNIFKKILNGTVVSKEMKYDNLKQIQIPDEIQLNR